MRAKRTQNHEVESRGFRFTIQYSTVGHFHTLRTHRIANNPGVVVTADEMEKVLADFTSSLMSAIHALRLVEGDGEVLRLGQFSDEVKSCPERNYPHDHNLCLDVRRDVRLQTK